VYTGRLHERVHGPYTAVRVHGTRTCTRAVSAIRVQRPCLTPAYTAVHDWNTSVYMTHTQPCTYTAIHGRVWPVYMAVHGPCARAVYTVPHCRERSCTPPYMGRKWALYTAVYCIHGVHDPYTAVYGSCTPSCAGGLRPRKREKKKVKIRTDIKNSRQRYRKSSEWINSSSWKACVRNWKHKTRKEIPDRSLRYSNQ